MFSGIFSSGKEFPNLIGALHEFKMVPPTK
jgi:hypothetical protein